MNFKQKHKDYLREHNLNSITDVAWHVEKVKKDGGNRQMMMDFAWLLINEKDCLESFFAENNPAYNKQADLVKKLAFDLKQNKVKSKGFEPSDYLIDEVGQFPFPLNEIVTYKWKPKDKEQNNLNKVIVHTNPFNTGDYCAKRERVKDVEKEKIAPLTTTEPFNLNQNIGQEIYNTITYPLGTEKGNEDAKKAREKVILEQWENNRPLTPEECFKTQEEKDIENFLGFAEASITRKDTGGYKKVGIKESQTVKKAPVFTYCKQMKNALEQLAFRSLYGHERYEKGDDWENFSRVPNAEFEYSNSMFRHALEIGGDEDEFQHLVAQAWNSVARLELYMRNNVKK